jgi:hypothetical protein
MITLKINGKTAAKILKGMNEKIIACVNCNFFENPPESFKSEFDCYGILDDVVETGLIEGLRVEKNVLNWFLTESKRIYQKKVET